MPKLRNDERLYIHSMGKRLRVTAWFASDDEANNYMSRHKDEGVIAVTKDGLVLLADVHDKGTQL